MKLFFSPASPFARKVMAVAHEAGWAERIELVPGGAHPIDRSAAIRAENPLGQIPTLVLDDGTALYDSRVICEYIDATAGTGLFGTGAARWPILARQALADGLLGAALLVRYEATVRPEPRRWSGWTGGQMGKVADALDRFEVLLPGLGDGADIGTITMACALGYLDFRFPDLDWRGARPVAAAWFERFDARPAMAATRPHA